MRMAFLGDSIVWGQGLLPDEKFSTQVFNALANGAQPTPANLSVCAHSGAIIGNGAQLSKDALNGEVPDSYPTIIQQCDAFDDHPESVDFVILDGGINDVDVKTILSPLTDKDDLAEMTTQYCYQDMKVLLGKVAAKFSNPKTRIAVTGYYPILSSLSDPDLMVHYLGCHGVEIDKIFTTLGDLVFHKIYDQCALFSTQSALALQRAVDETNAQFGNQRIRFAAVPFAEANAALAPESWLWGVDVTLTPQDPAAAQRAAACNLFETDVVQREICYRASVGHPNVTGAQQYAGTIIRALS